MIDREVIKIIKDDDDNVIGLKNQYMGWSPISTSEAIIHIERNIYNYYAVFPNIGRVNLQVENDHNQKILVTDSKKTSRNLLGDLPPHITYDD